jgi:hypothetical protein
MAVAKTAIPEIESRRAASDGWLINDRGKCFVTWPCREITLEKKMSDETKLNSELKNLEASLGRLTIPPTSIDRDELMYQSGWAAAMASLGHESSPLKPVRSRTPASGWVWPVATGLASAAAILFGVLLFFPSSDGPNSGDRLHVASLGDSQADNLDGSLNSELERTGLTNPPKHEGRDFDPADIMSLVLDFPAGQVLNSRLAFRQGFVTVQPGRQVTRPSSLIKPPATQQQLLDELLPNRQRQVPTWRRFFLRSDTRS